MLGQSKTAYQAEIDSACELIDFWRYNALWPPDYGGAAHLEPGRLGTAAITGRWRGCLRRHPFNSTAIAGNLPTAPALDGQHRRLETRAHPAVRRPLR